MESLENIVFNRFCHFLEQYSFKLKLYRNAYLFTYKDVKLRWWKTKQDIMFTRELNSYGIADDSVFDVCKFYYNSRKNNKPDNRILSKLADLWPILRQFQANSLEEMMVKMDLAGI